MQSKTTTVFAQLCNMLPREALINLANEKTSSPTGVKSTHKNTTFGICFAP